THRDQAFGLEDPHGLSDRRLAHRELPQEGVNLGKDVTVFEAAVENALAQRVGDHVRDPWLAEAARRSGLGYGAPVVLGGERHRLEVQSFRSSRLMMRNSSRWPTGANGVLSCRGVGPLASEATHRRVDDGADGREGVDQLLTR